MEQKRAYVTVLSTDEYLIGVLVLNESLIKVNSKYKLVVLINDNISDEAKNILLQKNIEVIKIKSIDLPEWIINNNNRKHTNWNYTFDKLAIFELTQFEKIVFLDSDMFVRNNIDELFDKPHMSATVDRCDTILVKDNYQKLTSGMLVIEPKEGIMSEFQQILNDDNIKDKYYNIGDQDIIQLYDTEWEYKKELHLPVKYNMFFLDIDYYVKKGIYKLKDISVIHFITSNKPWIYNKDELYTDYLDWLESVTKVDYEKHHLEETKENLEAGRECKEKVLDEYSEMLYKYKIR